MNERCQELRDGKKTTSSSQSVSATASKDVEKKNKAKGCPYYKKEAVEVLLRLTEISTFPLATFKINHGLLLFLR